MSPPSEDDERTWLDRIMRHEGRGNADVWAIAILLGVIGVGLAIAMVSSLIAEPWELDADNPVVTSDEGECGPLTGAKFEIEVEGQRHLCGGGDNKCAWEAVDVAYDADDPARCRVAANVDGLSKYEIIGVTLATAFMLVGVSGVSYRVSERMRMDDLVDEGEPRKRARTRLRTLAWVTLIAAIIVGNVLGLAFSILEP